MESIYNLGNLLLAQGKLDQAEPLLRKALERYRRVLGDNHSSTLSSINSLGQLLKARASWTRPSRSYARRWSVTVVCSATMIRTRWPRSTTWAAFFASRGSWTKPSRCPREHGAWPPRARR